MCCLNPALVHLRSVRGVEQICFFGGAKKVELGVEDFFDGFLQKFFENPVLVDAGFGQSEVVVKFYPDGGLQS